MKIDRIVGAGLAPLVDLPPQPVGLSPPKGTCPMKQHTPLPVLMQRTVAQFMPFGNTKQSFSKESVEKASRIRDAQKVHSVCPYCAVGCSLNVYVKDGKVIDIEGDPESPINHGTL